MKKLMISLLLLTLMVPKMAQSQSLSDIFGHDYEGASRPFSHSAFQNRWIEWMLEEYDLELADLRQAEYYSYFEMADGTEVAFEESFVSDDQVIFKLAIKGEDKADSDFISDQVELFDSEIDFNGLNDIYEEWTAGNQSYESYWLGDHMVDTYHEDAAMENAIVFRFYYPSDLFEKGDYPNLVSNLHDANRPQPNIYSEDWGDEEAYVNRPYLNRILDQIARDWGWQVSQDHLKTAGGTLYYYPEELAELGRVNEIYLYSGKVSGAQRLEIRMTNDFAQGENLKAPFLDQYYFTYFAQILQPELTVEEIRQGFEDFKRADFSQGGYFKLGDLQIRGPGFSSHTFSMARLIHDSTEIGGQTQEAILPEDEVHYPSVTLLAPADRIYEKEDLVLILEKDHLASTQELQEKILEIYEDLPGFGQQLEIEGKVNDIRPAILLVESLEGDLYQVYIQEDLDIKQGEWIRIKGKNLGIQDQSILAVTLLAESISQYGQEIYSQEGGDIHAEE